MRFQLISKYSPKRSLIPKNCTAHRNIITTYILLNTLDASKTYESVEMDMSLYEIILLSHL